MTVEKNKAIVKRYYDEIMTQGKLDVVDEIFAPRFINHRKDGTDKEMTREDQKNFLRSAFEKFSIRSIM